MSRRALVLLALLLASACEYVERPRRPLPEAFEVQRLGGEVLHRADFVGKPWLINLWVPG
jgi:hypothetical protein